MYARTLICLANSYKHGGRCIAGRALEEGLISEWVRPVSTRAGRELSPAECRYGRFRGEVSVGDIAKAELVRPAPSGHQVENHEIAGNGGWRKSGVATWSMLYACRDADSEDFWQDMGSSGRGLSDRLPVSATHRLGASLQLIQVPRLDLLVRPGFNGIGTEIRAAFSHLERDFRLKVTDPVICAVLQRKPIGEHPLGMSFLCVSISEPFNGFVYRLAAAIITPRRCEGFRR